MSSHDHIDRLLNEARDHVEDAIAEGKFSGVNAELTRSNRRVRALEEAIRHLASEVDRLKSEQAARSERD